MNRENFIAINELCIHYKVEMSFFSRLNDMGLIEINTIKKVACIHQDRLSSIEKILRLHKELDFNLSEHFLILQFSEFHWCLHKFE